MVGARINRFGAALVVVAAVCLAATGCGFSPIYAEKNLGAEAGDVGSRLASVSVNVVEGRVGHELRRHLQRALSGRGGAAAFDLSITLEQSRTPLLIQADDSITRFNLSLGASFVLKDRASGLTVYQGQARSIGIYNVVDSYVATVMAERDAEDRAAESLSGEIVSILSAYFSRAGV